MADDHPYVIPEMDPILRKQIQECNWQIVNIHREFRKPLIVMAAKNLLRNQNKHSDVEEGIRRLVLCSGKVYYELDEQRTKEDAKDVAVYAEVVWCQEEPMNMGGYTYILPRLITSMKAVGRGGYEDVKYAGRAPSAATATGFLKVHLNEQAELVQKAIQREPINFPLLRHSIYIVSPE
ncbi:hypothetical protein JHK87_029453 [Glycine soja]|nr:hypothetical protein JHK87_029453 [Glycine soja]